MTGWMFSSRLINSTPPLKVFQTNGRDINVFGAIIRPPVLQNIIKVDILKEHNFAGRTVRWHWGIDHPSHSFGKYHFQLRAFEILEGPPWYHSLSRACSTYELYLGDRLAAKVQCDRVVRFLKFDIIKEAWIPGPIHNSAQGGESLATYPEV